MAFASRSRGNPRGFAGLRTSLLVRLIDTHDLVGISSVDSILQLIVIIDECTDPGACEYTRLRFPGGVMWEGPAVPGPVERPEGGTVRARSRPLGSGLSDRTLVQRDLRVRGMQMEAILS